MRNCAAMTPSQNCGAQSSQRRGGHDLEQQQRQGHVEDIEAQGLVGVLGKGPEKIQADAQTDEQEHGDNGGKCFDRTLAYASPGRMSRRGVRHRARRKRPRADRAPGSGRAASRDRPRIRAAGPSFPRAGAAGTGPCPRPRRRAHGSRRRHPGPTLAAVGHQGLEGLAVREIGQQGPRDMSKYQACSESSWAATRSCIQG